MANYPNSNARKKSKLLAISFKLSFNSKLTSSYKKSKKQKAIANKELIIELAKWGNNLNQIAKHLNTNKGAWDRLGLEQLIEISNQLEQLRAKYVS